MSWDDSVSRMSGGTEMKEKMFLMMNANNFDCVGQALMAKDFKTHS